eukprot:TRINITY_DN2293_c0_g1_i5.p1 TRINITY_DN2293_c0_g1~~TRINITY_DN2293_c0_g1_i5.p1  ORF type:complete len:1039 (-),score=270.87 TRINITY_DN2293_c0_g1_i5:136-3252(-)
MNQGKRLARDDSGNPAEKYRLHKNGSTRPRSFGGCGGIFRSRPMLMLTMLLILMAVGFSAYGWVVATRNDEGGSAVPPPPQPTLVDESVRVVDDDDSSSVTIDEADFTAVRSSYETPELLNFGSSESLTHDLTFFTLFMNMDESMLKNQRDVYVHQFNSITSWTRLVPAHNIIVFVADQFTCDHVKGKFPGVQCFLDIDCVDFHQRRTDVSCIWKLAREKATTEYLTYVNGDIILLDDFVATFKYLKQHRANKRFVAVGQRTDINIKDFVDFSTRQEVEKLFARAAVEGQYHGEWGIDYFIHHRSVFDVTKIEFPPFLAGVFRWDNWLLSQFVIEPNVDVVDATLSVRALHQDDAKRSGHWERDGAPYNDALATKTSGYQYRIGNVFFADFLMNGQCLTDRCTLIENMDRDSDLVMMFRRKDKDLNLAVLTVNTGYMEMAMNWLCWARRVGFENFILLAEDQNSFRTFSSLGAPVVVVSGAPELKSAAEYGSREFQETMRYRTNFLYRVLDHGMNFMTADIDTVWMDNPFNHVDPDADLQGQQHKIENISGGLVYVKSTNAGLTLWKEVMRCQEKNIAFIMSHKPGTYTPSEYDEQYCINQLSFKMISEGKLKRALWKNNRFPDGRSFFEELLPQRTGVSPVVIHNNWIVGIENKIHRFKNWGMWALDSENKCVLPHRVSAPELTAEEVRFTVKVLTFDRQASLERLLRSLSNARYASDHVKLIVSIDFPTSNASEEVKVARQRVVETAQNFEWIHGEYLVEDLEEHRGLVGQWINSWNPTTDNEILIVFEDDLEVSKWWFTWTRAAVNKYFVDKSQFDPRMFGIALQSQHTILGESVERKYGEHHTSQLIPQGNHLFRYQLVGTWGTILFPQQWREFVEWYHEKQVTSTEAFPACVPNVFSNTWYKQRPGRIWSQWIIRFAFEKGYYMLYTNFLNNMALVVNHREAGENFLESKGPSNEMLKSLTPVELSFPPLQSIPLYDFAFYQVKQPNPDILAFRQNLFPQPSDQLGKTNLEFLSDKCWIHRMYLPTVEDQKRS